MNNPLAITEPNWILSVGISLRTALALEISEQIPEFTSDQTILRNIIINGRSNGQIVVLQFMPNELGPTTFGTMEDNQFSEICRLAGDRHGYEALKMVNDRVLFRHDLFTYVGNLVDNAVNILEAINDMFSWVNDLVLPRAEELNRARVQRAVPFPPQFALISVKNALWVLECEHDCKQGTAFELNGFGLVTCAHVVGKETYAFKPDSINKRYPVRVCSKQDVLDLAVLEIDCPSTSPLKPKQGEQALLMSHVAVCGFPNYRHGDSGILSPGLVVGHRIVSGVTRLLTNAGIVSGMSGGPAVGERDEVVGICVTGAEKMSNKNDTEDQAIIPVSALDLLPQ